MSGISCETRVPREQKGREYPPPILSAAIRERSRRFKRNTRDSGALMARFRAHCLIGRESKSPIGKRNTADPFEIIKPYFVNNV